MTNLPALQTISYANPDNTLVVTFGPAFKSSVKREFAWADSRRTKKWDRLRFAVKGYTDAAGAIDQNTGKVSLDANMTGVMQMLSAPGGNFTYTGRGMGGQQGNGYKIGPAQGFLPDAEFGPRPELINFVPIGAGTTCYIEWEVTCCVPSCPPQVNAAASGLAMVDYGLEFSIENGYTRITHTILAEIPMSRTAANTLPDTIDRFYDQLAPPVPAGFSRAMTPQDRKLSLDRRRIECTFVDVELAYPLPDGVSAMEFEHRSHAQFHGGGNSPGGFVVTTVTVNVTVRLPKGTPVNLAFSKFWLWLAPRLSAMQTAFVNPRTAAAGNRLVLPSSVDYTERSNFLDPSSTFNLTLLLFNTSLQGILLQSGMYQLGGSYATWAASTEIQSAHNPRGAAGIRLSSQDDALVDLCIQSPITPDRRRLAGSVSVAGSTSTSKIPGGIPPPKFGTSGTAQVAGTAGTTFMKGPPLPPQAMWLDYRCWLEYDEDDRVACHVPLAGTVAADEEAAEDPTGSMQLLASDPGPTQTAMSETVANILQQVSPPVQYITLRGSALRAGFGINPPRLVSLFGRTVTQVSQRLVPRRLGALGLFALYGLEWSIRYVLDMTPANLPDLADPVLGLDGDPIPGTAPVVELLNLLAGDPRAGG